MEKVAPVEKRIRVPFALANSWSDDKGGAVEKDLNGKKHRYLIGISSGPERDAHGERMSEKCIKGFMDQSSRGDILLYPDVHGIKQSEDIGRLEKGLIDPNGDWRTEFRLYDESDGIGAVKAEKINDIWRQVNGIAPYTKPMSKGFSVEGIIPDSGTFTDTSGIKVLDAVELDGVCLVPRPAYNKAMVQRAVEKSLSGQTYGRSQQLKMRAIAKSYLGDMASPMTGYYNRRMVIDDQLDQAIAKVLTETEDAKDVETQLKEILHVWDDYLIKLIMDSRDEVKGMLTLGSELSFGYKNGEDEVQAEKIETLAKNIGEATLLIKSFAEKKIKEKK